ncbi:type II secretion system protein GspL [Geomonas sp.]|uniref:type II secretion system protein GspL n=1 Tax=Geomonas sp. TaxID=2651584 RepID=UPI002B4967A3|nr:type II secretion system protein GspL [Geomonas sp.]HJV33923.1 type II secretion system protein GspL [Geomonas sp.]
MDLLIIQLKRSELIMARFRPRRGGVSFLSAERHLLENGDEQVARILSDASFNASEHRVILALPPTMLFMRELQLPIAERAKVRELLPLELKGETALDTEGLAFDALPLSGGKFLAVWGRSKELIAKIELLKGVGLEPEMVTASLFHWDKLAFGSGTVAVTDGEALAAYTDGSAIFFRAFPASSGEAELPRTLAALELARGVQVDQVISHAKSAKDSETLAQATAGLSEAFGDDAHAAHDLSGAYAVAAAVADGSIVNLRRGPLAYTAGNQKLYKKLRLTALLAASLVLLLFAESGVRLYLARRDVASLDASILSIYKEIFPSRKKPVDEVAEVRSEIKRLQGAKTSSNVLKVLKQLADIKGDDIGGIYETEIYGSDVRLKGDARNSQAVTDFKGRAAQLFNPAEVSEVKSRPDGSVTFTFAGTVKEASR